jgi:sugar phosphate isomerase/epimerase
MDSRLSVSALCFPGMPPLEVLETVARIGASHTTLHAAAVAGTGPAKVRARGQAVGVSVEGLIGGLGPNLDETATWDASRSDLARSVDLASEVGAGVVYILAGSRRWCPWEEAAERFASFIAPCIEHAAGAGVSLAVEPAMVMYADLTFVHTARDAFALTARVPGLKVDLDLFHVWTEMDLRDNIASHVSDIGLVQVGDFGAGDRSLPSRAVLGDGLIPTGEIVGWLYQAGYRGIVDLELNGPRIDEEGHLRAATRGAAVLDGILARNPLR